MLSKAEIAWIIRISTAAVGGGLPWFFYTWTRVEHYVALPLDEQTAGVIAASLLMPVLGTFFFLVGAFAPLSSPEETIKAAKQGGGAGFFLFLAITACSLLRFTF